MAVAVGVPALLAIGLGYFVYQDLLVLGKDPDAGVLSFVLQDGPDDLQDRIAAVETQIANERKESSRLEAVTQRLSELKEEESFLRDKLPNEKRKGEVRETIQQLVRQVPAEVGTVDLLSVKVSEEAADTNASSGSPWR